MHLKERFSKPRAEKGLNWSLPLIVTEICFGSLLHACRVPFRGYLLSLNQIYVSAKIFLSGQSVLRVSTEAGMAKLGFSVGKKMTPAVAIWVQGGLFHLGALAHPLLGAIAASLWSFVQPMLWVAFLTVRSPLEVLERLSLQMSGYISLSLELFLIGLVVLKAIFAVMVCLYAYWPTPKWYLQMIEGFENTSQYLGQKLKPRSNMFRSILNGVGYLFVVLLDVFLAGEQPQMVWIIFRALSLFLMVYLCQIWLCRTYLRKKLLDDFSGAFFY